VRGVVSCIKHGVAQDSSYFLINLDNGIKADRIETKTVLGCGEYVDYDLDGRASAQGNADIKGLEKRVTKLVSANVRNKRYVTGNEDVDRITADMWRKILAAARLVIRKVAVSAPIIVRFHNDADGSSGAYSLYLSVKDICERLSLNGNIIWIMQRGVSYSAADAENDILISNNYTCIEKPLLVLIDFGTSLESNAGIENAKGRFDMVWLDHHPPVPGFKGTELKNYINPWQFKGDSSYTAGLLTSVLCKSFSGVDTKELEGASLIGDYSKYAGADGADTSALLDFITSDLQAIFGPSKSNITPQEIETIMNNPAKARELLDYANIKLEEAIDNGMKAVKRYAVGDSNLCVLDFEHVRHSDSKYPLPGRFSSKLVAKLSESGISRTILVVNVGAYILMRLDKELCQKYDLLALIGEVKLRYTSEIEAGGGHRCAGTIKIMDKSRAKEMTNSLIAIIKSELSGQA